MCSIGRLQYSTTTTATTITTVAVETTEEDSTDVARSDTAVETEVSKTETLTAVEHGGVGRVGGGSVRFDGKGSERGGRYVICCYIW